MTITNQLAPHSFQITDHWEYGAVIHETMSRIPLLTNTNYADFILKPSPNKDYFKILSTYKSCFFGYACCKSLFNHTLKKNSSEFFFFSEQQVGHDIFRIHQAEHESN
jgi:hypothetical protein